MKRVSTMAAALFSAASMTGAWADSTDPIRIPMNEWTGQHISARITGTLLRKLGYAVEYPTAGAVPQFKAIAEGDQHVQPEVRTNNVGAIYPKAVESGDIVVLGQLGLKPQEGWIYNVASGPLVRSSYHADRQAAEVARPPPGERSRPWRGSAMRYAGDGTSGSAGVVGERA